MRRDFAAGGDARPLSVYHSMYLAYRSPISPALYSECTLNALFCLRCPLFFISPQLATLFSWYAALLILWIRRPWYDTAWGENDSMSLNEADEEEEVRTHRPVKGS